MYLGDKKIKSYEKKDGQVKVLFEDGTEGNYPERMYNAMLSAEPSTASDIEDKRVFEATKDIVTILLMLDMKSGEVDKVFQMVTNNFNFKLETATAWLWTEYMGNKVPFATNKNIHPAQALNDRTINDIDRVIKSFSQKGGASITEGDAPSDSPKD
jgi:hypothetical protein